MKKILIIGFMAGGIAVAGGLKLYEVKSGKIDYSISGGGNMMGMMQSQIKGEKHLVFDAYGKRSLTEELKVTNETVNGHTQSRKEHTMTYMNGSVIYTVDFRGKQIMRTVNPMVNMVGAMMGGGKNGSMTQTGLTMLKQMGGRKTGTEKILGYTCDVWELAGTKQCLYKGVVLKLESDVMGMKQMEVATKAEFDIDLSDDDFALPDMPVIQMDMSMMMSGGMPQPIDKSKLKAMDEADNKSIEQGMSGMQESLSSFSKEMEKKKGTVSENEMEQMMMGAMLPQLKQNILKEEAWVDDAYDCYANASTLKDANRCGDAIAKARGESVEPLPQWNEKMKNETLTSLKEYKAHLDCIKKANTLDDMDACDK